MQIPTTVTVEIVEEVTSSVGMTATVLGRVSNKAIATTTQIISEPTFWDGIVGFLMFWI